MGADRDGLALGSLSTGIPPDEEMEAQVAGPAGEFREKETSHSGVGAWVWGGLVADLHGADDTRKAGA